MASGSSRDQPSSSGRPSWHNNLLNPDPNQNPVPAQSTPIAHGGHDSTSSTPRQNKIDDYAADALARGKGIYKPATEDLDNPTEEEFKIVYEKEDEIVKLLEKSYNWLGIGKKIGVPYRKVESMWYNVLANNHPELKPSRSAK